MSTGDGFQNRRNDSLLAPQRFFSSLGLRTFATALYQLGKSQKSTGRIDARERKRG